MTLRRPYATFFLMRVMGIDPGSQFMGIGCVEWRGNRLAAVGHALIGVKQADNSWADRLRTVYLAIESAISLWQPDAVAVESVFMHKNASSALKLGQARGAAIAAVAVREIPLFEYSPREVKQAVASSGGADKDQVEIMVRMLLAGSLEQSFGGGVFHRADEADALAVAICHAQRSRVAVKFAPSMQRPPRGKLGTAKGRITK